MRGVQFGSMASPYLNGEAVQREKQAFAVFSSTQLSGTTARLGKLREVTSHCLLDQFVGPTTALRDQVVELLFHLGGKVHFQDKEKTAQRQCLKGIFDDNPWPC